MTRITTTHAVADKNNRVASELPRIRTSPRKSWPRAAARSLGAGFQTGSCRNKRTSPRPDQYPISNVPESSIDSGSSIGRRWRQQIAEPADGLDDVDVELLADAPDEHLDGVGVTIEILVIEMLDQLGARHHA